MNRIIQFVLAVLVAATLSGCASTGGYWTDRGRDAADIFTVTGGLGLGAKVRVGPVATGLLFQSDTVGLRGGGTVQTDYDNFDIVLLCSGLENFSQKPLDLDKVNLDSETKCWRGKEYRSDMGFFFHVPREKYVDTCSTPGFREFFYHTKWPYYTQIDVVAAAIPSVRFGFNPGELLDFLLGFTTLDIADDDTAAQQREKARPRPKAAPRWEFVSQPVHGPRPKDMTLPPGAIQLDAAQPAVLVRVAGPGEMEVDQPPHGFVIISYPDGYHAPVTPPPVIIGEPTELGRAMAAPGVLLLKPAATPAPIPKTCTDMKAFNARLKQEHPEWPDTGLSMKHTTQPPRPAAPPVIPKTCESMEAFNEKHKDELNLQVPGLFHKPLQPDGFPLDQLRKP